MGEGEFALVRQQLAQALSTSVSYFGAHDVYATLVDVAALQRDQAALREYLPQAEALAVRYDHRLYRAIVHRAWGVAHRLAAEYPEAADRLSQALTLFQALDTRWQTGRTLFERGELAVAQGERDEARAHFQQALALFEAMRAAPDAGRARAALAALL